MVEARMGIAENDAVACLKRLRESRLKSETLSTVIHILSRCYEDPKASEIFSQKPTDAGGGGNQGEEIVELRGSIEQEMMPDHTEKKHEVKEDLLAQEVMPDPTEMKLDVKEDIFVQESAPGPTEMKLDVKEDLAAQEAAPDPTEMKLDVQEDVLAREEEYPRLGDGGMREFSIDEIENMIMDVDVDVDVDGVEEPVQGDFFEQEFLQQVQKDLLEAAGLENELGENGVSDILELDMTKGEGAQCGNENDDCSPSRKVVMVQHQQLNRSSNMLERANSPTSGCRTNVSDGFKGEIDKCSAVVQSRALQENTIDTLQQVQKNLLETAGLENDIAENSFSKVVEDNFAKGEAAQCSNEDDDCSPAQKVAVAQDRQMNRPNMLENGKSLPSMLTNNASDDIEEGEINNCSAHVQSCVSQGNNIDLLQHSETGANELHSIGHSKLPKEALCSDFSSSISVHCVDNEKVKCPQPSSDTPAECVPIKCSAVLNSVAKDGLECPIGNREPVFYGDITEGTLSNSQGTLKTDADIKKKRGGNSKERRKTQKRKKRAELDKKLGVKRMKLPQPLKPKVIKVCEHYLKGRCLKGEECTFSHDATPLTKSKACVHFARNSCMKGDACPYDHELWKYPCDNYASKGVCNRGSGCSFSHEMPAKDKSQGTSIEDKLDAKASLIPGTNSKSSINNAAKIPIKPPMHVPKGLSFLSMGKSDSDHLTKPNPIRSPQKIDVIGSSNHSTHNVPRMSNTLNVTSRPFSAHVTSNNDQSDHSNSRMNSDLKAVSSKKIVDSTSPLDQALRGLNSLVPSKFPISNKCKIEVSAKEQCPSVSPSGLGMHQSYARKENSDFKVVNQKGQISKPKFQVVGNMHVEAAQEVASTEALCLTPEKASVMKRSQKVNTAILTDQGSNKNTSIKDPESLKVHVVTHNSSGEAFKTPVSGPSSSSQGLAGIKNISSPLQNTLVSASSFTKKFASETKGSSLVSAENSQFKKQPESTGISSRSSSFNYEPVKASAILDFIFGTGAKTLKNWPLCFLTVQYHRLAGWMELQYQLMREFERVIGQCEQAEKISLSLNIPDNNNGVSEEQGSMILSITSGFAEAGSSSKNENSGLMEVTEQGGSSFPPHEMMIHVKVDKAVPKFLLKLYEIVDNPNTDYVVHWGFDGQSFIVGDAAVFCNAILPNYFKHSNFSSFIRQLNTYGFRKIDSEKWEFAMEEFQRGKRHLLKNIKRKRAENKRGFGPAKNDDTLLKIQKAMSVQISNLTQQVEVANSLITAVEKRVQLVELKYKRMACVLSKTIRNPGFIAELIQRKALIESKHGGETSSSEQKTLNTLTSDDTTLLPQNIATAETPNQAEMQVSVYIPAWSCGDSSNSPTEPQETAVTAEAVLESLHGDLMNETEPFEEMASEKCIYYFHELESLITVNDEPGEEWAAYMDTDPTDIKP